jgi:phage terminase large subunit-like protein
MHSLKALWSSNPQAALVASRKLCRTDLWFLLRYACRRIDLERDWLFERCREVQASPDGHLDLWSRDHYKSTFITFGKTIQDILASHGQDPLPEWGGLEPTFGIFSHTRPIAKKFLRQIKMELEGNDTLKSWFPDVLYENPFRESPKWSEDDGITVKRRTNPKEATVEAWGLVDGQPTSVHFMVRIYDDVVTRESVTTPEQISKVTSAWELSQNLGTENGRVRTIGTRYHYHDTYKVMMDRGVVTPRIYPATDTGEFDGTPVLWDRHFLQEKIRTMGPYTAACQLMQDPKADDTQGFKREWLVHFEKQDGGGMNVYLLVDPAGMKKKTSDRTAMVVIGLCGDKNYYLLDAIWDRLNLKERTTALFFLHRKWRPKRVGYEQYGMQADIEHIKSVQEEDNYRFQIIPLGGRLGNLDRIRRLIPLFAEQRFYLPYSLHKNLLDGSGVDLVERFITQEYEPFPVGHADLFDIMSRILDDTLEAQWPQEWYPHEDEQRYSEARAKRLRMRYASVWTR